MIRESKFTLADAFGCALRGIRICLSGRNFRIELCFMVFALAMGALLQCSGTEWAVIVVCIALVLGGEVANTAFEALVDLASPDYHDLARDAKDSAAGAVLLFAIGSAVAGCIIFLPKLLAIAGIVF